MAETDRTRAGRITLGHMSGRNEDPAGLAEQRPSAVVAAPSGPDASAVIEVPFPESRVLRWTPECEPGESVPENDIALMVTQEVFVDVNRHASQTLDRELGGFLLGNRYRCPNTDRQYLVIDQSTMAQFTESSAVHLSFTLDTWAHLAEELSGKFLGKLVVGWYHSHPQMDVFLSSYDVAIHEERFSAPWTTALVVEPEKNRGGFFRWQGGKLNPRVPSEFYELVARRAEGSVVDWTNHVLAGGHRPEPAVSGRRPRTFGNGGVAGRERKRRTGALEGSGHTWSRRSPVVFLLAGTLLGAALCGGAWFGVDTYRSSGAAADTQAPAVAAPPAPAELAPPVKQVPDIEQAPPPPPESSSKPKRKRSVPKPRKLPVGPSQGA